MSEKENEKVRVAIDDLRIGHYVDLERSWKDHPFLFSRFKIASQAEIDTIRELGMTEVTILPDRCDPAALEKKATAPAAAPAPAKSVRQELWDKKQELIQRASGFRGERQQAAYRYQETVKKITQFSRDMRTAPANAVLVAEEIVEEMVSAFDKNSSVLVNLVNLSDDNFSMYSHSLNVTVLSLVLGRYVGLGPEDMRVLGMGGLLHDLGKIEIPTQITSKSQLNHSEEALLRTHPLLGSRIAQKIRTVAPAVVAVIEQHHENLDGTGFPRQLKEAQLAKPVRIVAVANIYDNLCNPIDPTKAMSPRDAMAILFKTWAGKLDKDIVGAFIKAMGVYPPGTVVQLSDENIGMVVSVDPEQLLRPRILLYNPDIPRQDALMVDLRERPDLEVKVVLKPSQFPARIYEYLGMSERLGYFHKQKS
jgi:putative nucleotidyltransferase with HDIG domain